MRTKDELAKHYATLTDRQLLDILNEKDQYTDIAIQAALGEMQKREIEPEQVEEYYEVLASEKEVMDQIALIELTLIEKVKFYFLWLLPFMGSAIRMNYAEQGLKTKVKQSKVFSIMGFLMVFPAAILEFTNDYESAISIGLWILLFIPTYKIEKIIRAASNNRIKQGL